MFYSSPQKYNKRLLVFLDFVSSARRFRDIDFFWQTDYIFSFLFARISAISWRLLSVFLYWGKRIDALLLPTSAHQYRYKRTVKCSWAALTSELEARSESTESTENNAIKVISVVVMRSIFSSKMLFNNCSYLSSCDMSVAHLLPKNWKTWSLLSLFPPPVEDEAPEVEPPSLQILLGWLIPPTTCDNWSRKLVSGLKSLAVRILTTMSTFFRRSLKRSGWGNLEKTSCDDVTRITIFRHTYRVKNSIWWAYLMTRCIQIE